MPTNPLIEALLRRAGRGVAEINTRSGAIGASLQPYAASAGNIYGQVQGAESALGGAVQQSLAGAGQQLGGDISGKLAGIQAPGQAVSQHGGGQATMGAQSGAAVGALSSAELGRLQGYGTAEQIYASALPRLAALAGDQERRGFLAQAQAELGDLALQESARMRDQARDDTRYQDERNYDRKQDLLDRRRQMQQDRIERSRYLTEVKRKKKLDTLATRATNKEYGLDVNAQKQEDARDWAQLAHDMSDDQIDNQLQRESLNERRRSALQREKAARVRADKGDPNERQDYFYDVREDAFEAARSLRKEGPKSGLTGQVTPLPKAEAQRRLWTEYGQLLVGRGYNRQAVRQMIARALDAAGY